MTVRTGFIARGFIPFSTLVASHGYGYPGEDLIPTEEAEPETRVGRPGISVKGETRNAPCFVTVGPTEVEERVPRPKVKGDTKPAPRFTTKVEKKG